MPYIWHKKIMEDFKIEGIEFISLIACFVSTRLTFTNLEEYAKEGALSLEQLFCLRELSNIDFNINNLKQTTYIEIVDGKFNLVW